MVRLISDPDQLHDAGLLGKDPNHALTVDEIQEWDKEHGEVPKGSFAALRTDMYKDWDTDPERFNPHFPNEPMI